MFRRFGKHEKRPFSFGHFRPYLPVAQLVRLPPNLLTVGAWGRISVLSHNLRFFHHIMPNGEERLYRGVQEKKKEKTHGRRGKQTSEDLLR